MKKSTLAIIRHAVCADDDVSEKERKILLRSLARGDIEEKHSGLLQTAKEVCADARLSRQTLWRIVKAGKLKPVRIRGLVRFRRTDVEALIDGRAK